MSDIPQNVRIYTAKDVVGSYGTLIGGVVDVSVYLINDLTVDFYCSIAVDYNGDNSDSVGISPSDKVVKAFYNHKVYSGISVGIEINSADTSKVGIFDAPVPDDFFVVVVLQ